MVLLVPLNRMLVNRGGKQVNSHFLACFAVSLSTAHASCFTGSSLGIRHRVYTGGGTGMVTKKAFCRNRKTTNSHVVLRSNPQNREPVRTGPNPQNSQPVRPGSNRARAEPGLEPARAELTIQYVFFTISQQIFAAHNFESNEISNL